MGRGLTSLAHFKAPELAPGLAPELQSSRAGSWAGRSRAPAAATAAAAVAAVLAGHSHRSARPETQLGLRVGRGHGMVPAQGHQSWLEGWLQGAQTRPHLMR